MQSRLSLKLLLDHPPTNLWEQVQLLTGVSANSDWGLDWGELPVLNFGGELTVMAGDDGAVERALDLLLTLMAQHDGSITTDFGVVLTQTEGQLTLDEDPDVFWTPRLRRLVAQRRSFRLAVLNHPEPTPNPSADECFEPRFESIECSNFSHHLKEIFRELNPTSQRAAFVDDFLRRTGVRLDPEQLGADAPAMLNYLQENSNFIDSWPPLSPALVIGGRPQLHAQCPWLYLMEHQHGGYEMTYRNLSGAVLRLQDHPRVSRFVLSGFEAMEEDPDWRTLRKHYSMLEDLTGTYQDSFTPEQLERLHQFIAQDLTLPRFQSGLEALVECEACDPWEWFAGWKMVGPGDIYYTAEVHAQLRRLFGNELRVFFLWGNCD